MFVRARLSEFLTRFCSALQIKLGVGVEGCCVLNTRACVFVPPHQWWPPLNVLRPSICLFICVTVPLLWMWSEDVQRMRMNWSQVWNVRVTHLLDVVKMLLQILPKVEVVAVLHVWSDPETMLIVQASCQVDDTCEAMFKGSLSSLCWLRLLSFHHVTKCSITHYINEHNHGLTWMETASRLVQGDIQQQAGKASWCFTVCVHAVVSVRLTFCSHSAVGGAFVSAWRIKLSPSVSCPPLEE